MANANKTLLNKDNLEIYPITRERNVYDANNVNLKEKFKNVVFKDNEVHQFAEGLYEESANEFNEITAIGNADNNTGAFTYTSTGNNLLSVDYMPMKPSTVYSYATSKSGLWIYEYDSNRNFLGIIDIVSGRSFTSKPNTAYFRVAFWGSYGTTYLNDAIIKEGTNPVYYPFNQNRHITNSEAEFLKEEHEKQSNLLPLENKEYSGSFSNTWDSFTIPLLQSLTLKAGKKYSWSAKIKSSNGCRMNKLGLTTNEETLIDLYNLGALTNNYITVSKTFTPTTDIVVNYIYVHNATVGSVDIKEINVVEGDLEKYNEYNSSSHITNAQADLLKHEEERSKNKLEVYGNVGLNTNGLELTLSKKSQLKVNGTATADGWYEFITNGLGATGTVSQKKYSLGTNKNYTFSFNSNVELPASVNIFLQLNSSGNVSVNRDKKFVTGNNFDGVYRGWIYIPKGTVCNNLTINLQLEEGDTATFWSEWNGEILRPIDIEPVLLWENATPNVAYQDNNAGYDLGDYKEYDLWFKLSSSGYSTPVKFTFKKIVNSYTWVSVVHENNGIMNNMRELYIDNNSKIYFRNAWLNNELNFERIIPLELYGRNY